MSSRGRELVVRPVKQTPKPCSGRKEERRCKAAEADLSLTKALSQVSQAKGDIIKTF